MSKYKIEIQNLVQFGENNLDSVTIEWLEKKK